MPYSRKLITQGTPDSQTPGVGSVTALFNDPSPIVGIVKYNLSSSQPFTTLNLLSRYRLGTVTSWLTGTAAPCLGPEIQEMTHPGIQKMTTKDSTQMAQHTRKNPNNKKIATSTCHDNHESSQSSFGLTTAAAPYFCFPCAWQPFRPAAWLAAAPFGCGEYPCGT